MNLIVMFKTPFYDYDEKAARSFSPYSLMIDSIVSYSLSYQFGTSFAVGVPVSAVPDLSVAVTVAAVPNDPSGRVRYATVCRQLPDHR